jgi:hypothetical protein
LNLLGFFDSGFVLPKKAALETSRSFVVSDAMLSVVVARIVGVNMLRFLLYTALALNFSALAVTATDRYGGWLLEQPRSSVRTLSFKQSVQLNNKIETLELGFICDRRKGSKSVGVILIPFDGTFQSDQDVIPVLIQKNGHQYDPSDLLQNWKNGANISSWKRKITSMSLHRS